MTVTATDSIVKNDRPGPGSYQPANTLQHQLTKPSDSKLGSGGLAAKSHRRNFGSSNSAPSPGTYNIAGNIGQRHDFSRKYSSMFQKPIAERVSSSKSSVPAPNQYDVFQGLKTVNKTNNVTATAAFRSKTKRANATIKTMDTPAPAISAPAVPPPPEIPLPGPGAYNIRDFKDLEKKYMSSAAFVSSTSRWTGDLTNVDQPGPGTYSPHAPNRQSFNFNFERKWM
ncbi:unnamed protein product [Didymodactylos carnosus]|uniref:O(6)-methylguanine-induced apoptosis 2 n=1 Tax=Didymodactylos carnosus TaxID=1234261 RepID=A0A813NZ83_9BILA|nr:unnamed protein product [Didymodactylos carnosus]CAF1081488.1 unnamed protein product [Didymodactylos carnosus]CAF3525614.1 unnamed protein product [Didymodactylos carnosus]CAF3844386.1 unnamed protein product [Didymodactylos carnosus]